MKVRMFTDGACSGNPGPGGYAALITLFDKPETITGFEENTTNNRMELSAVINGLERIFAEIFVHEQTVKEIEIISDSTYVVNAINDNWIGNWKSNDFKNKQGDKIKNEDLWRRLYDQLEVLNFIKIKTVFTKVKGHSGNYFNEMVDGLARQEIKRNMKREVN